MIKSIFQMWTERRAVEMSDIRAGQSYATTRKMTAFYLEHGKHAGGDQAHPPVDIKAGTKVSVSNVDKNFIYFGTGTMQSVRTEGRHLRTGFGFFTTPGEFASAVTKSERARPTPQAPDAKVTPIYEITEDIRAWPRISTGIDSDAGKSMVLVAPTRVRVLEVFRLDHGGNPEMAKLQFVGQEERYAYVYVRWGDFQYSAKKVGSDPAGQAPEPGKIVGPPSRPSTTNVQDVKSVDPDVEFDRLIKLRDEGKLTPEQFGEKSKRLFGFMTAWMLRRAQDWLEEIAPKMLASYKRDRSMGLDHETSLNHSTGNWAMYMGLKIGHEISEQEMSAIRKRIEQMVASEGGGGTGPQDWTIAHMMPEMAKTASALWRLHFAKAKHSPAYEKETAVIRENKKKPEAKKPHDFKAAEWTHPNGHPRCITCGGEEIIGGRCNVTPTAEDYAEFEKELDAEFPDRVERRKKQEAALVGMFERGEITHTEFQSRLAMTDETERLLSYYWSGRITQTDLDQRLQRLRASA